MKCVLASEVVEGNHVTLHTKAVEEIKYGLRHHRRSAEIVLNIFGSFMCLEVSVTHYRGNETSSVLHSEAISLGVWTVKGKMEVEVGEIAFKLKEVLQEEHFVNGTCTIEIVHFTVTHIFCLEQVHDLCTKWSHTSATANPNHLTL